MFFNLFLLLILQYFLGTIFLFRIKLWTQGSLNLSLSILLGLVVSTIGLFVLDLVHIPISLSAAVLVYFLLLLSLAWPYKPFLSYLNQAWTRIAWTPKLYDLLFFGIFWYLFYISAWRAYYLPVTPFDAINGIDLIAKFTVKEHTLVNSVFDKSIINGLSTQVYYAPFTNLMQVLYRMMGFPWGQVWLSIVFASGFIAIYRVLSKMCHPAIAGICSLLPFMSPELFAYTFLLQTDFSNAIFFTIGVLCFRMFFEANEKPWLWASSLFFFAAVWSRSESIFFLIPGALMLWLILWRYQKQTFLSATITTAWWAGIPAIAFVAWNIVFYKFYFPFSPDTAAELKTPDYSQLTQVMSDMNELVVFADDYWGYGVYFFMAALLVQLVAGKERKSYIILAWIGILYFVFALLKLHFVHVEISMTFRRGYFKLVFLFFAFIALSGVSLRFSKWLSAWEKQ